MAVQRVGACLRDALAVHDGKAVAVIGHRATKFGIMYCCGEQSIAAVVNTIWEWQDVPIWRYELHADHAARRLDALLLEKSKSTGLA
jgi:hypothetical protein